MVRRMVGLSAAMLMLVLTALPAYANDPGATKLIGCRWTDPGTVSATIKWDETSDPNEHLLHRLSVDSTCTDSWSSVQFRSARFGSPYWLEFFIEPGAVRTLGIQALQKLGYYQWQFFTWTPKVGWDRRHIVPPACTNARPHEIIGGYILANGTVYHPSPCASS